MLRLLVLLLLVAQPALAFPEMVRKGYQSCVTCHVSPSGGGVLTDYGREIFKDVLSTWSRENEHQLLHGLVNQPEFLKIGGDIRRVQSYVNTPASKTGRWFLMQANVEAALVVDRYTLAASADYDIQNPDVRGDDKWTSLKHYLMVQVNDYVSLRAGKFQKNFGLGIPDHTTQIRRGIGFDEGSETYNAELNYIAEKYSYSVTYVGGRPDDDDVVSDKGIAFGGSYYLGTSNRIGGSFFQGTSSEDTSKRIYGPNWALSYDKTWYWLGEADLVQIKPKGSEDSSGFVTYNRIGYELFKGFDVYGIHELKKNDFDAKYLDFVGYGPGFQWSPRPHFIFSGQWEKQLRPSANKPRTIDYAYFIAQYSI
jgi:hypothetical protein